MDSAPSKVSPVGSEVPPKRLDSKAEEELEEEETWWETRKYDILEQWDKFRDFAWDPVNRTVLGRDKKSWSEIGIFYLIFYGSLAVFWTAAIFIFLETVPEIPEGPKYTNLIEKPGMVASQETVRVRNQVIDASLATANADLLTASRYTNQSEITALNSGAAAACNSVEGSQPDAVCVYLAVNRMHGWTPAEGLSIGCHFTEESDVTRFGTGIYQVVHSYFPLELFQPGRIHNFVPRDTTYRNPVTIVVFPRSSLPAAGTIDMTCAARRSALAIDVEFKLEIS